MDGVQWGSGQRVSELRPCDAHADGLTKHMAK